MAQRTWTTTLDGVTHTIHIEHAYFSGRLDLYVDNQQIPDLPKMRITVSRAPQYQYFPIGQHVCSIRIGNNGFTYNFDLIIDGRSVQTGNPIDPLPPVPL